MSESEKQEGQKTVVAFIAGLLIGGLLVWVFSSSPQSAPQNTNDGTTPASTPTSDTGTATGDTSDTTGDTGGGSTSPAPAPAPAAAGEGFLNVANQPAGSVVTLGEVSFPTNDGWVAVRDFEDGVDGRILGAARYSLSIGLVPESVSLLRATEPGMTYKVVFYTENGDLVFDLADDVVVADIATTFTAQ